MAELKSLTLNGIKYDSFPGTEGKDGVSATHSWNGTVLTITSASGTSSADLKGDKGDSIKGDAGADGVSPTVAVSKSGKVTTVSITDKNGTKTATINDGADGAAGSAGKDGTSVTVKSVSESTADGGSNVVTFSDGKTLTVKNGSKGSTGATGSKGDKGDPGNDYVLTAGDKADIAALVIETLGGSPIFGVVDSSNNIVVSGDLPDGTYSVKYEMENGSKVNIGNLVIDTNVYYTVTNTLTQCTNSNSATKVVQGSAYSATITAKSGYELKSVTATMGGTAVSVSNGKINIASVTGNIVITAVAEKVQAAYTNLLPKAVDANGSLYNGGKGYKSGCKMSTSSGSESAVSGAYCSGFMPVSDIYDVIRIKNITLSSAASINNIVFYNSKKEKLYGVAGTANAFVANSQVANGVYSVQASHWLSATSGSDISFFRFSCGGITDGTIVTVNEEI